MLMSDNVGAQLKAKGVLLNSCSKTTLPARCGAWNRLKYVKNERRRQCGRRRNEMKDGEISRR